MNAYVTVDRVKMTKLYPEGGAEAPPVADAAKICWRPRCAATRIRAPKYAPGKFFSLRSRPIDPLPAKTKKKDTRKCILLFGAGDEARTRYLDLGKVALYQMSYARTAMVIIRHETTIVNSFFHSFRIISTIPQVSLSG